MRVLTELKRGAILQAAAEVFQEVGFKRASMAEISARAGGSKATLYRYFRSKEELFVAVVHENARRLLVPGVDRLMNSSSHDLSRLLRRFGEQAVSMLAEPSSIKTLRSIISEAEHNHIGALFYAGGPKQGLLAMAEFFQKQMQFGRMRQADPLVAARHYMALLESELVWPRLIGDQEVLSRRDTREAVRRAVDTFIGGYRPIAESRR